MCIFQTYILHKVFKRYAVRISYSYPDCKFVHHKKFHLSVGRRKAPLNQGSYRWENWKMSGNLCYRGNVREKHYFEKVRENDLGSCRLQITDFLHLQILKSRQICGFH